MHDRRDKEQSCSLITPKMLLRISYQDDFTNCTVILFGIINFIVNNCLCRYHNVVVFYAYEAN